MMRLPLNIDRLKQKKFIYYFIAFLIFISLIPLSEPYEGAQVQSNNLREASDWWDLASPIIPYIFRIDTQNEWRVFYGIILFFVTLFFKKILEVNVLSKTQFLFFSLVFYLTAVFAIRGGRDGIAFALILFGLYMVQNLQSENKYRFSKSVFIFFIFYVAFSFKIALLPLIVIGLYIYNSNKFRKKLLFFGSVVFLIVASMLFLTSSQLVSKYTKINKTFPAQQVMFYDLVSAYCWSIDKEVHKFVDDSLVIHNDNGLINQDICKNLTPNGWDTLHSKDSLKSDNLLINKISANDSSKFYELQKAWITYIYKYPKVYFEVKSNFIGQVLFMNNAFERGDPIFSVESETLSGVFRSILLSPSKILDYVYASTYFFALGFCLVMLIQRRIIGSSIIILLIGMITNLLSFVADNGRYALPYILLFWIVFLCQSLKASVGDRSIYLRTKGTL